MGVLHQKETNDLSFLNIEYRQGHILALVLLLSVFGSKMSFGQSITVNQATTISEVEGYVQNVLLGSCVTASNITFSDTAVAAGTFNGAGTILGFDSGILLTTGLASNATGPDNGNSVGMNNWIAPPADPGDPDLTVLASQHFPGISTFNAAILEFDFIPQSDTLRFNYIFGSEEYPEYVNSPYNDVFGFFISGPGISGPFSNGAENIALVPNTALPVSIENINNGFSGSEPSSGPCNNCQYYVDNSSGPAVEYDGYTTVLTAQAVVTPCQTYHIKLAIADAGDSNYDSGVFLEAGSFSASGEDAVELAAVSGVSGIYEGCDVGTFIFTRLPGGNINNPVTVFYNVSGTATEGVDYAALPGSITIPAGQDSAVLYIEGVLDYTPEGVETVTLELVSGGCTCTPPPMVSMNILDNDTQLSLSTSGSITICLGESANLTANPGGSISPYTSGWDNGAPAGNNVTVSPTTTTTYTYTVTDACGGQTLSSSETVTVVSPSFIVDEDQQCFNGNDFAFTSTGPTGATITHFWDFDDGATSTLVNPTRNYAAEGVYNVTHTVTYTVTGCTATADTVIQVFQEPSVLVIVDQNVSCVGGSDGALSTFITGGASPYTYDWLPNNETTPSINNLSVGNYTVTVTDAHGCSDVVTGSIIQDDSEPPMALCQNATAYIGSNGFATISATVVDNGSTDNCGISSLVVSPNAFSCAEVGPNAVVLTVTDVNGNVSTCNAIVTVQDTVPPDAICQDVTVQLDGSGNATVTAAQIDNGSTDNCAVQSISVSPNTFNCANVGTNAVTLSVTDVGGNTSTCNATVTVQEDTDPTAVCQDITVALDASGNVSVTGTQLGSGSTDNCGIADISVTPSDFDCSSIGDNPVTVTVTDGSGNTANCAATVSVEDNLAPNALCVDITVQLDASGNASIIASDVDGGSNDNCGIDQLSVSPNTFTCADLGPNAVTLSVSDVNGNMSSCSATVTVLDTVSPTAICQDISIQLDGSGNASVTAGQIDNGSTDNCSVQSISLSPNAFDCSNIGPNQVTLTVTDGSSNSSNCLATVTVNEGTPPTAVCQDITVQLDASGNATIVASQVDGGSTDNCGVAGISIDNDMFDCSVLGANSVTLTVTDVSGNESTCVATVTVEDNIPPTAACQNLTIQLDASGNVSITASDLDAGSTDNCAVNAYSADPADFTCADIGVNVVTLTVTDASGNASTCTANVTVEDIQPPTAVCQDVTIQLDVNGNATVNPGQVDGGSADACGIASISLDQNAFDCSNQGANVVELTVVDNSGNSSSCTATVTVQDNISPDAICQNLTVYLDGTGIGTADPNDVNNGSTDNCGIDGLSLSQTDFLCADLGQAILTLTVSDQSGNTDDCIAVVTVLDTVSPVITNCPADITVTPDSLDCTSVANWNEPVASDNCSVTMTSNYSSGDSFPSGTTVVTYDAEDQSGNTAQCTFSVTVVLSDVLVSTTAVVNACGFNISCNGSSDGEATATASGGCAPYTFQWSDNQNTQTATGLDAGVHVVLVTDVNGTQVSDTVILTEPQPLVIDSMVSPQFVGGTNISCAGATDGSVNLNAVGGASCTAYDYSWTGPNGFTAATKDISGLGAGTYTITITDANGCSVTDSITLTEPEPLTAEAFPTTYNGFNVSCFGLSDGFINLSVSAGTAPYSYQWSNGETTEDIDSLFAGNYTVLITDSNGCQTSLLVELAEPTELAISPTDTVAVSCNGGLTGQFVVQASGGVPSYSYLWSNGDMDPILNGVGAGTYQVQITDGNGCMDSLQLTMTEPSALQVSISQITDATCFGDDDGDVTLQASGGVGPYDYQWPSIGQNGATASGLSAGSYIFEVSDANGCEYTDTAMVSEPNQIILITSNDTTICPNNQVLLSVEATGGGGTYLITWDNGQGFGNTYEPYITQTSNISVTAVDQNGCPSVPNSVIVTTQPNVVANFTSTVVDPCFAPFEVEFANTSTNAASYNWSFSNGDSSTQALPTTSFDEPGVYQVNLVVTSAEGCVDSVTHPVVIDNLPVADFEIPYPNGCYPIVVGFYNHSIGATSYAWDFGDGTTSDEGTVYHFFENPGVYDVSLIVTNQNGCMDTLTIDSAVFAYPRPVADFIPIMVSAPEPGSEFTFINNSTGANEYLWNFGSGDFSDLFEPSYDYPDHGSYTITLHAYNEYGCTDTATASVFIELTSGLFVPNAMITGEPGEVGLFLPKGEGLGDYHVWVYDLWGNLLWESTELADGSPAEGWNGRYHGALVPQGAYAWRIEAIFKDGEIWEGMLQKSGKKSTVGSVTVLH